MGELVGAEEVLKLPGLTEALRLEGEILKMDQVPCPTKHYFSPGLYAREMFIPAGTVLTGATHKVRHLAVFVGDISVWEAGKVKRLTGHHTFISEPGAKRVGYAHSDTYCTGFFPTEKTDVAELERELIEEDPAQLQCNKMLISTVEVLEALPCLE